MESSGTCEGCEGCILFAPWEVYDLPGEIFRSSLAAKKRPKGPSWSEGFFPSLGRKKKWRPFRFSPSQRGIALFEVLGLHSGK